MNLHERMKQYEAVPQIHLMRRTPVIIRLNGVAFHTFTKKFDKPFDAMFGRAMRQVTCQLVENIQGCVVGYTQSDEISLVIQDYKNAWFGYNVQKLVSVSAKMATYKFYKAFEDVLCGFDPNKYLSIYWCNTVVPALKDNNVGFDSCCFNLPFEEVNNYFVDRQRDAEKNSINLLAQQYYTQKELNGINTKKLQDKLFTEQGVNWNDLPIEQKRGFVYIPKSNPKFEEYNRFTPVFSQESEFINSLIRFKED